MLHIWRLGGNERPIHARFTGIGIFKVARRTGTEEFLRVSLDIHEIAATFLELSFMAGY